MRKASIILAVLAVALLGTASTANAADGTITSITCDTASFKWGAMPQTTTTVYYTVQVDSEALRSSQHTNYGDFEVGLGIENGDHTVQVRVWWTNEGGGSAERTDSVSCGGAPNRKGCPDKKFLFNGKCVASPRPGR